MTRDEVRVRRFVLGHLGAIGAQLHESDGRYVVDFPSGKKKQYGRQRTITFNTDKRKEQVELVEVGSPFLKSLLLEAKEFGYVSSWRTDRLPPHSRVYCFQLESYSSARKRTGFVTAEVPPGNVEPRIHEGVPPYVDEDPSDLEDRIDGLDVEALRSGLETVMPLVQQASRSFAAASVKESTESFHKAMDRVQQYIQGMRQDTYLEEAKIKKRLGEIQSKLYFTEDGIRERKLQMERDKLTDELHELKQRNKKAESAYVQERAKHEDQLRRRHEPKLKIRLVAAVSTRAA